MKKFSFGKPFMALFTVTLAFSFAVSATFVSCDTTNPDDDPDHDHIWGAWTVTTPATCTAQGLETRVCARNESHTETRAIAALGHSWGSWSVITQPTATQNGMEARTCARNPSHIETRAVPATGAPGTTPGTPGATPGGSAGGTLTITGIPSEYNGKYIRFAVDSPGGGQIWGCASVSGNTWTNTQISGGTVTMPTWKVLFSPTSYARYVGSDTIGYIDMYIMSASSGGSIIARGNANTAITFTSGSATVAWPK
jgi:hypothetical protein